MNHYDLLKDAPFEGLDIPAPEKLETADDFAQLMQHILSEYRASFNLYYRKYGFAARQQLLGVMKNLLTGQMPARYPDYVKDYPDSLPEISMLVCAMMMVLERQNQKGKP